jgi:hypothetical protein
MARISRVVIAEVAHHVTQRGVRRINIFSSPEDKNHYMEILSQESGDSILIKVKIGILSPDYYPLSPDYYPDYY